MPRDEPDEWLLNSTGPFDFQGHVASNPRSPHPYHRRGPSLSQPDSSLREREPWTKDNGYVEEPSTPPQDALVADDQKRKWTCNPGESTESGTEADDEKESSLLRLPAPSGKPRKGLKGSATGSPLLSPSVLDDEERKAVWEAQIRQATRALNQQPQGEETQVRDRFRRRRRAEIYRRATETTLLLTICCLILGVLPTNKGLVSPLKFESGIWPSIMHGEPGHFSAVEVFLSSIAALYALYPGRIIWKNHGLNAARKKSRFYIHVPAAFDPAPLLYPILLPLLCAWSICEGTQNTLLPNLALGISSIPSKIIPGGDVAWFGSPQWLISVLPLACSREWADYTNRSGQSQPHGDSNKAIQTFVFPLHQSLLPILHHFTTTSLLSTELHLLSSGLINLYLLSEFPQAKILDILLWVGGPILAITCSKTFQVGVAIARIPSWRFSRSYSRIRGNIVFTALRDCFDRLSSQSPLSYRRSSTSDEDISINLANNEASSLRRVPRITTTDLDNGKAYENGLRRVPTLPARATGKIETLDGPKRFQSSHETTSPRRYRSNTLPNFKSGAQGMTTKEGLQVRSKVNLHSKWSLRSLTWSQALVLRWLLALYAYMVMIVTIIIPIRWRIGSQALQGVEPIGWALGYLFGDFAGFSSLIEQWKLQDWIDVDNFKSSSLYAPKTGRFARWRVALGFANTRLFICAYALIVIALGLAAVFRLSSVSEVDTRRKVFHGMMVAMFLPTIFIDPTFVALAFSIVLAIFLILDLIRASQLPPLAAPLTSFLAPYVDGRDHRGPVVVSHIFLLIGCAIPLWLSLASLPRNASIPTPGWEVPTRELSMISGVVCVGMGDAAASLIGRRYGRRRWCWAGGKSLEGSLAFAIAVVIGLTSGRTWLLLGQWHGAGRDSWPAFLIKTLVAGSGASLTEAVLTGGNDNVIVPVILWLLVKGLDIS